MNLTQRVIGGAIEVHRNLGCGFLEKVYEKALAIELNNMGIQFKSQVPIKTLYKGSIVGRYIADMVIEEKLLIELKAIANLGRVEESLLINYLRASRLQVGLLLNFGGRTLQIKRRVVGPITGTNF